MALQKSRTISNTMFDNILQEIVQSHPFSMLQNFETLGRQRYCFKRIKSSFEDKGMVEQGLENFFFTSNNSPFFDKTISVEQYLYNWPHQFIKFHKPEYFSGEKI